MKEIIVDKAPDPVVIPHHVLIRPLLSQPKIFEVLRDAIEGVVSPGRPKVFTTSRPDESNEAAFRLYQELTGDRQNSYKLQW